MLRDAAGCGCHPAGEAGYLRAPSRARIGCCLMFSWIGAHFPQILLVVAVLVVTRTLVAWIAKRSARVPALAMASGSCNKCGWSGRIANSTQACGRCGSRKITMRTSR